MERAREGEGERDGEGEGRRRRENGGESKCEWQSFVMKEKD